MEFVKLEIFINNDLVLILKPNIKISWVEERKEWQKGY
jgi:hypothetical protein